MIYRICIFAVAMSAALPVQADVRVFVLNEDGSAGIYYECTAGETVRAFPLDVTVDTGEIIGITNFLAGMSSATQPGYGIFPASFRDHIIVDPGNGEVASWDVPGYTPLAVPADDPVNTQPGLDSSGVTLEFAAYWPVDTPGDAPASSGKLCTLVLSEPGTVSLAVNSARGDITLTDPELPLNLILEGSYVAPQGTITDLSLSNSTVTVVFENGELEIAPTPDGTWAGTGNSSGTFTEPAGTNAARFYRAIAP